MKVCHILLRLDPKYGGPTASVPAQCIGTHLLGAEMFFLMNDNNGPYKKRLLDEGINIIEIPSSRNELSRFLMTPLRSFFRNYGGGIDLFHTHGVWSPSHYMIFKYSRKRGIKYVVNPRGDLETYRVNYDKLKRIKKKIAWVLYAKSFVENASCIIATSEQEAKAIRRMGTSNDIAIIPNAIDISPFIHLPEKKLSSKRTVLFLSRVNPIKGLEYLINAWAIIPQSLRDSWNLCIAGNSDPDNYIDSLIKLVHTLHLDESISFIGAVKGEKKKELYCNSDLFVLPTLNENFGNVVAEALLCRCPVITTKNAPWSGLLDQECGWWIDLTIKNLSDTLEKAMSLTDNQRHSMGMRGREFIINTFSPSVVAQKTISLYKWILEGGDRLDYLY